MMQNLKITAKMLDGRINVNDGIINLDSVLSYVWMMENHADKVLNNDINKDNLIEADLPIQKDADGRFKVSVGFYHQFDEKIEHWHKKINDMDAQQYVDFKGKRGKINGVSGEYKAYRIPQTIRVVGDIEFYCVGDKELLLPMLHAITNLGKKAAQGYGAVKEWVIEEIENDYSATGPYGIMRATKLDGPPPEGYRLRKIRLKPPYHLHFDKVLSVIPNPIIEV